MKISYTENKKLRCPSVNIEWKNKFYRLDLNIQRWFIRNNVTLRDVFQLEREVTEDERVELLEKLADKYLESLKLGV